MIIKPKADADLMVRIEQLNKWFGNAHVLKNISLNVKAGEKVVICGPSGSGKSTLIRCINQLEQHQQGVVEVLGEELNGNLKGLERIRRQVGMCFQHFGDHFRVEGRGWLVEQHDLGLHAQRPGNGDSLLLTAGQL